VYDKILELRIANAQIIVNYAAFLEENKYFEESFKVGFFSAKDMYIHNRYLGLRKGRRALYFPCLS